MPDMDPATQRAAALQEAGKACPKCGGYGKSWDATDHMHIFCAHCNGTGEAPRELPPLRDLTPTVQDVTDAAGIALAAGDFEEPPCRHGVAYVDQCEACETDRYAEYFGGDHPY